MSNPTPPGYYDDGTGQRRWFDGHSWTDQVEPPRIPAPPMRESAHQAPTGRRGAGKKVVLSVLGLVGVVVVISAVGAAMGGGSDSTSSVASVSSSSGEASIAAQPAPKKPATTPGIGAKVRDGKFAFVVSKISQGKTKVGDQYLNKTAQGEFVLVYVTVENIGDEAQLFDGSSQILYDAKGRKFSSDGEAGIYLDSKSFLNEINPGNKVNGIVVFDVPKGTKAAKVELHDSPFSGGVDVRLAK